MPRKATLSDGVRELIRWRWNQRPTLKSLAQEYRVSESCIKDAIFPNLAKRYRNRKVKAREYEGPVGSGTSPVYPARKVSRRKG